MAKKQTATKKIKKKKWFPIVAPQLLGGKVLGETILTESSLMKGKYISMNLMNILGDPKRQNTNVQLHIKEVRDGQGITEIVKIERITSFIKRVVRRGRNKIEDSFITKSGDGKRVRIKTISITNSYAPNSVGTKLRKAIREHLKEFVNKNTFEKSIDDILRGPILKEVRTKISKIVPVRTFDIRVFKLETKRDEHMEVKVESKEVVEAVEEVAEEVKEAVEEKETVEEVKEVSEKEETKEEVKEEKIEAKKEVKKASAKKPTTKKAPAKKVVPKKEAKPKAPAKKTAAKK